MCAQYANNYFLTADPESPWNANRMQIAGSPLPVCACQWEMFSVPPEQSQAPFRWAITGATVHSKVLPTDHSLNYVVFHIL